MKKNSLLWSLAAASMMFFASCENENVPGDNIDAKEAIVSISIASKLKSGTEKPTEEATVEGENKITHFEAYAFDSDGKFLSYAPEENGKKTTSLVAEVGNVTIAVVANSYPLIGKTGISTLDDLQAKISEHIFTRTNSTEIPKKNVSDTELLGFVMSATEVFNLKEGTNSETISLKRTVSKFLAPTYAQTGLLDLTGISEDDIKDLFPSFAGDYNEIVFDHVNASFVLANGLDRTLLFNAISYVDEDNFWPAEREEWLPSFPFNYLNSLFEGTTEGKRSYQTDGVYSKGFAKNPVYVHENFPYPDHTVGSVTGYNPKEVYCFIVKGTLKYKTATPVVRYWRINLVKTTENKNDGLDYDYYRIFRNGLYKVNVDKIKTIGYGSPEEAEEEVPVIPVKDDALINITVTPAEWDVYISNTQM